MLRKKQYKTETIVQKLWVISQPTTYITPYEGKLILREKCPYSKLFWFAFSHIWTEYAEILCISPYLVRMRENADQNNSKCEKFLCSVRAYFSEYFLRVSSYFFRMSIQFAFRKVDPTQIQIYTHDVTGSDLVTP